jgi:hypothetical protein
MLAELQSTQYSLYLEERDPLLFYPNTLSLDSFELCPPRVRNFYDSSVQKENFSLIFTKESCELTKPECPS